MIEYGQELVSFDAREPLQELVDRGAVPRERPPGHERRDAPRRRTDSTPDAWISPREIRERNSDHLWALMIVAASTDPKLTPKVTPYGADARATPGHHWKRKSANSSVKCTNGRYRTRVDRRKPSF